MAEQRIDLGKYMKEPLESSTEEMQRLEEKLNELSLKGLGAEERAKEMLLYQKALRVYPRISPEFLRERTSK